MMGLTIYCLVLLLAVGFVSGQSCPTDRNWIAFAKKCYNFMAYPRLAVQAASSACQENGATLVSINTPDEHSFISKWLLTNDLRRDQWITSGVTASGSVRWEGDGTVITNFDRWITGTERSRDGLRVLYAFHDPDYSWTVDTDGADYSFICEIGIDEVYRIVQQQRGFDYGLNLDNPGMAPRGPTFLQEPQETMILSKTNTVFLECLANGVPDPSYEWLIQNNSRMTPLKSNSKFSFTTGKLEISSPTDKDENMYQCKASNEYGTILSTIVQLSFGKLDEFSNVPPAPVNGLEYDGAQLECPKVNARPAVTYQWYKNDFMSFIRPNYQTHTFISANGKLLFSELAPSDQATYYCLVTLTNYGQTGNYIGATQTESRNSLGFTLTVVSGGASRYQPKIQNDFIYVYPPTPLKGGPVNLECFAYGTGPLRYTWSRAGGKPLPVGHSFDSSNRILRLEDVKLEDGGTYTCRVQSSATNLEDSKTVDLQIQAKPYFTYPLTPQHVDVGGRLTWHCEAAGHPLPTYQWYKNGEVLRSSAGVTITVNTLTIDNLDAKRDNGMYQCSATNRYGTTFSTAQLRVLEIAPSFGRNPMIKTMAGALGGQVTIICDPVGAPVPKYQWYKESSNLNLISGVYTQDDHYKLLLNGNLIITNIQAGDAGKYTCEVENALGKASDYTNLRIMERAVISQKPIDQRAEVNITATLLCQASHPPDIDLVYIWIFNDHVINYYAEPEYRQGEGNQKGSLYIIATQYSNEGRYTCTATTGMDQLSASAFLTVVGPPGEPAGVYVLLRSIVPDADPNNPANDTNSNTTRWVIWTDGLDRGSPITHYFVEFRSNFDMRWRVHPDGSNVPVSRVTHTNFPTKRYIRLTNLKAGAGIEFRVLARNSYGIGAPSLPTAMAQISGARPTVFVTNVRGGGGSVGDLTIVWDPLPIEDHNGPNLKYIVSWRTYEAGSQSDSAKWQTMVVNHNTACYNEPDFKTGLVYLCKYVVTVGPLQFYKPYEAKVQASNIHGDGPSTLVSVIMSAEELPLGAPETPFANVYNATALLVTWKPVPNNRESARGLLKGYKINYWRSQFELESQAMQNIIELKLGQDNLREGLIIGLEPVTWYTFNVQAYNHAGNGPKSSDYEQQTLNNVPEQYPTEVHVYSVEGFGVRVNFRGISTQIREEPLQGYKVQVWKAYENIRNANEVDFGKLNTGVIRNLSSSELYELRVFGYSRGGQGKRSSPSVYFTVGDGQILINAETTEILGGVSGLKPSFAVLILTIFALVMKN